MTKNSSSVVSSVGAPAPWLPVGQRLRNRRVQLGFRKGAVAAHLGVSTECFEEIEAGQVEISPTLLAGLSELLKVPVFYFFEDKLAKANTAEPAASDEERLDCLVASFRKLSRDAQQQLLALAKALEQHPETLRAANE